MADLRNFPSAAAASEHILTKGSGGAPIGDGHGNPFFYEEGDVALNNAGDATGTFRSFGRYTKIGSLVIIHATIIIDADFTNNQLGGLPYNPSTPGNLSGVHGVYPVFNNRDRDIWIQLVGGSPNLFFQSEMGASVYIPKVNDSLRFCLQYLD